MKRDSVDSLRQNDQLAGGQSRLIKVVLMVDTTALQNKAWARGVMITSHDSADRQHEE